MVLWQLVFIVRSGRNHVIRSQIRNSSLLFTFFNLMSSQINVALEISPFLLHPLCSYFLDLHRYSSGWPGVSCHLPERGNRRPNSVSLLRIF